MKIFLFTLMALTCVFCSTGMNDLALDMHEELWKLWSILWLRLMCCCGVYKLCRARESSIHIADGGKRP